MKALLVNILFLVMWPFLLASCSGSRSVAFHNSSVVPAAVGSVKINKDNNKHYTIELMIKHLAEPGRLNPPGVVYVVWMETADGEVTNLGQMNRSGGEFSETITSSLKTVTTHEPKFFVVTAEKDDTGQSPGPSVVLRTGSF